MKTEALAAPHHSPCSFQTFCKGLRVTLIVLAILSLTAGFLAAYKISVFSRFNFRDVLFFCGGSLVGVVISSICQSSCCRSTPKKPDPNSFFAALRDPQRGGEATRMFQEHPELLQERDWIGNTPLHVAAGSLPFGDKLCTIAVPNLLRMGADCNAVNNRGEVPLHSAAKAGNVTAVSHLCNQPKIKINARDKNGETPYSAVLDLMPNGQNFCDIAAKFAATEGATWEKQRD